MSSGLHLVELVTRTLPDSAVAGSAPAELVEAVRVGDCAHTLAAPPGTRVHDVPQECLFCGETTAYVGSGRCSSCARLGRQYEVVS